MGLELKAKLSIDNSGFMDGLNYSKKEVQKWNRLLAKGGKAGGESWGAALSGGIAGGIAGVAVSAFHGITSKISSLVGSVVNLADSTEDISTRTGVSTTKIQEWGARAKSTGLDIGTVVTFNERLARSMMEAVGGDDAFTASLEALGVSADDLKNKNLFQIFEQIGGSVKGATVDAQLLANLIKVGGRGAGQMIPFFKEGGIPKSDIVPPEVTGILKDTGESIAGMWRMVKAKFATVLAIEVNSFAGRGLMDFLTLGRYSQRRISRRFDKPRDNDTITADAAADLQVSQTQRNMELADLETPKEKVAYLTAQKAAMQKQLESNTSIRMTSAIVNEIALIDSGLSKAKLEAAKEEVRESKAAKKRIDSLIKESSKATRDLFYSRLTEESDQVKFLEEEKKKYDKTASDFSLGEEANREAGLKSKELQREIEQIKRKDTNQKASREHDALVDVGNMMGVIFNPTPAKPKAPIPFNIPVNPERMMQTAINSAWFRAGLPNETSMPSDKVEAKLDTLHNDLVGILTASERRNSNSPTLPQ